MNIWILLLRGINVGGRRIRMQELVQVLESLGLHNVKTYIQSGNVVFQANVADPANMEAAIATAIERDHGFRPRVLLLPVDQFEAAVAGNPFPEAEEAPKTVHLFFLAAPPTSPAIEKLQSLKSSTERFLLSDRVFYLHTPDGFGRSKLAEKAERLLGVPATARNWRTIKKISALAASYQTA